MNRRRQRQRQRIVFATIGTLWFALTAITIVKNYQERREYNMDWDDDINLQTVDQYVKAELSERESLHDKVGDWMVKALDLAPETDEEPTFPAADEKTNMTITNENNNDENNEN